MKKIFTLMIGFLLLGVNVYAAGDLVVNGQVGIGADIVSNSKLYMDSDKLFGLNINLLEKGTGSYYGARYNVFVGGTSGTSNAYGSDMNVNVVTKGASLGTLIGGNYEIRLATSIPTTINNYIANKIRFSDNGANTANHTANNVTGIQYEVDGSGGTGMVTATSYRGMYLGDNSGLFNGTTHSQIWVDKITGGTTNYGIVLNGDGAGSDIVFGPNHNVKLYTKTVSGNTDLWVKDSQNNETQLGPHDPVTGEWIFYSKNVKTGKVVRVEMEKLVKAVEKLTGEKFMIETMMDDK